MSETDELLTALGDVGVAIPSEGDAGDEQVRSALRREIAGGRPPRRRSRLRLRRPGVFRWSAVATAALAAAAVVVVAVGRSHVFASHTASARNVAYIVKRVRATIAAAPSNTVITTYDYASGNVTSDGSLANLGGGSVAQYTYTAADGTEYVRAPDGESQAAFVFRPAGNGTYHGSRTLIDDRHHTYSKTKFDGSLPQMPGLSVSGSQSTVRQALQSGHVTGLGTTTVNGRQALALKLPNQPAPPGEVLHRVLYVDAHTYDPLRVVEYTSGPSAHPGLTVDDWLPATPGLIARAEDDSIPAGYTKTQGAPTG